MIMLDYMSINRRWGESGLRYSSWINYAFSLGYLSNIDHYFNSNENGNVSLHIERNDLQGADYREGRIHYYGSIDVLRNVFDDWFRCSSAGNGGKVIKRINSTSYIESLISDYNFGVFNRDGQMTLDIFPPEDTDYILDILCDYLGMNGYENTTEIEDAFWNGFNI